MEQQALRNGSRVTTLFLGDTELSATVDASGATTRAAVRHLATPVGSPLATQHGTNTWTWLTADTQHSVRNSWTFTGTGPQVRT